MRNEKYENYLKRNAEKPLKRIFTKLENGELPMSMSKVYDENEEGEMAPISEVSMFSPVIEEGAMFSVTDIREYSPTPYDFCMTAYAGYESIFKRNLATIITGIEKDRIGIKVVLEEYKNQLDHLLAHNRDIVVGFIISNINKLTISAVIDFFNKIYKEYPEKAEILQKALAYIINDDNELFNSLFIERRKSNHFSTRIGCNPPIDSHHSFESILYNTSKNNNGEEQQSVDHFMGLMESKIAFSGGEMTTLLYDKLFKILSKIELTTQGLADLGYDGIMNCLDKIGFDVLSQYHDSLIDMLQFTFIKVNALYYNHGTFQNLYHELADILYRADRKFGYTDDDDYDI